MAKRAVSGTEKKAPTYPAEPELSSLPILAPVKRPSKSKAPAKKQLWCLEMVYSGNVKDIRFRCYTSDEATMQRFLTIPEIKCDGKNKVFPKVTNAVGAKRKKTDFLLLHYIELHIGKLYTGA